MVTPIDRDVLRSPSTTDFAAPASHVLDPALILVSELLAIPRLRQDQPCVAQPADQTDPFHLPLATTDNERNVANRLLHSGRARRSLSLLLAGPAPTRTSGASGAVPAKAALGHGQLGAEPRERACPRQSGENPRTGRTGLRRSCSSPFILPCVTNGRRSARPAGRRDSDLRRSRGQERFPAPAERPSAQPLNN